ncbi:IS630 family transposase [Phormidesmis sp. 146-12]
MPASIRNFLTCQQVGKLQQALKESQLPHIRERILILLLQNDGKSQHQIARFLGCSPRTVAHWCKHGDPDKLESLHNKREQEHYRKATPEYVQRLLETVDIEPTELGYEFGRWTAERLATYLAQETGITLSGSQVRRILKRKKFNYIWAKYSLEDKQNPEKRAQFKEKLAQYLALAKEKPERVQVWYWDESGFSLRVIRRKTWGKRGQRKKMSGRRGHGRVNVMGAMREVDRKRVCFFIEKGNADVFYEQVKKLHEFVQKEWVEQASKVKYLEPHEPKIVIVLDNASYHKRLDIRTKISEEFPNIVLEFLPAYSPDYNLIELVWYSCKEYIAHRLFTSVEELRSLIDRLLNQGELHIQWQRKIKNKGSSSIAT